MAANVATPIDASRLTKLSVLDFCQHSQSGVNLLTTPRAMMALPPCDYPAAPLPRRAFVLSCQAQSFRSSCCSYRR
eukprot:1522825-Pleurochrysis_carterae.AAC.2